LIGQRRLKEQTRICGEFMNKAKDERTEIWSTRIWAKAGLEGLKFSLERMVAN